jgi:hypothetical protein
MTDVHCALCAFKIIVADKRFSSWLDTLESPHRDIYAGLLLGFLIESEDHEVGQQCDDEATAIGTDLLAAFSPVFDVEKEPEQSFGEYLTKIATALEAQKN